MPDPAHRASAPSATFFESASGVVVNGGTFIATNALAHEDAETLKLLKPLYSLVALNAILNQGGRVDQVRCYPGTREEIITKVEAWRDGGYLSDQHIFWLSGPAGAGKSAIVQTIAERCIKEGVPMITFFFFRSDSTRNNIRPLVPTLVFQLFNIFPSLKKHISRIIRENPVIFQASLAIQFQTLITDPILQLRLSSPSPQPILLLLDGLDECDSKSDQSTILRILHELVTLPESHFIALVASRKESQIVMAFNSLEIHDGSIYLDDSYRPEEDILHYARAELAEIRRTHPLRDKIGPDWPSEDDLSSIVSKSSGQFIYAATVLRFMSNPSISPRISMQTVLGIRPAGKRTPFAEIDAVYMHILAQVDDWDLVRDVLVLDSMFMDYKRSHMVEAIHYSIDEMDSSLIDLAPLLRPGKLSGTRYLHFYHASFNDFLGDRMRSGDFYIDHSKAATKLFHKLMDGMCNPERTPSTRNMGVLSLLLNLLRNIDTPTVELTSALQKITNAKVSSRLYRGESGDDASSILRCIQNLYERFDVSIGTTIIRCWFSWFQDVGISSDKLSEWKWARPISVSDSLTQRTREPRPSFLKATRTLPAKVPVQSTPRNSASLTVPRIAPRSMPTNHSIERSRSSTPTPVSKGTRQITAKERPWRL